jgi:hypothetical protein
MRYGTLYLVPVPLHEDGTASIPEATKAVLAGLRVIIAERARTARHWLKVLCPQVPLPEVTVFELDKHRPDVVEDEWLAPAMSGRDIGLMSEAGCPGVADPGSRVVARAMHLGIPVQALDGPSAILLARPGTRSPQPGAHGPAAGPDAGVHRDALPQCGPSGNRPPRADARHPPGPGGRSRRSRCPAPHPQRGGLAQGWRPCPGQGARRVPHRSALKPCETISRDPAL